MFFFTSLSVSVNDDQANSILRKSFNLHYISEIMEFLHRCDLSTVHCIQIYQNQLNLMKGIQFKIEIV